MQMYSEAHGCGSFTGFFYCSSFEPELLHEIAPDKFSANAQFTPRITLHGIANAGVPPDAGNFCMMGSFS
jgi:hypothetical protein